MKMTPEIREKRAQAIAALNNVSWDEAEKIYRVNPPGVRNGGMFYIVRKNETGKVQCDCEEFLTLKSDQPDFRCEHILAAKYWAETNRKREAPAPTIPHNHQGYVSNVRTPPVRMPTNPVAKSLADLITPKQIGLIRALCRDLELDPDEECQEWTAAEFDSACKVDEISKRAASWFIEHLKDLVKAEVKR